MQLLDPHFYQCVSSLLKYTNNEYILEGVRKVLEVLIFDEPDDVTKFLPEKKADYVKIMLSKAAELNPNNVPKEQQPHTTKFIEKIFDQALRFLEN